MRKSLNRRILSTTRNGNITKIVAISNIAIDHTSVEILHCTIDSTDNKHCKVKEHKTTYKLYKSKKGYYFNYLGHRNYLK